MGQKKLKEERRERTREGLFNNGPAAAAGSSRAGKAGWLAGDAVVFAVAAVLAVIAFLVFMQSLGYDFVIWDDNILISENRNIQTLDPKFFKWVFTSVGITTWYPVTLISFAIDYAVWGPDAQGFHLTNIIFHSFNVFLVFILTVRLVEHASPAPYGGLNKKAFIAALTTALLFGLHPLRIESVVWIAERKDVLYGFFFLLSVISYLRYVSSDGSKKKAFYYASLVLFAMSFMSKPMAITLPVVLLILDFYPLDRL
ncbi:MAG: hypothetical protein HY890_03310, partial [Deltaproteobacteria bacterium]|nr:hypothetical protein [Deltaproteobacteria bacterium]